MGITAGQASRELGISTSTLSAWADKGRIKAVRSAGGWRLFDQGDIQRVKKEMAARAKGGC